MEFIICLIFTQLIAVSSQKWIPFIRSVFLHSKHYTACRIVDSLWRKKECDVIAKVNGRTRSSCFRLICSDSAFVMRGPIIMISAWLVVFRFSLIKGIKIESIYDWFRMDEVGQICFETLDFNLHRFMACHFLPFT